MPYYHDYFPERRKLRRLGESNTPVRLFDFFDVVAVSDELEYSLAHAALYLNLRVRDVSDYVKSEGTTFGTLLIQWRMDRIKTHYLNGVPFEEMHVSFKMTHNGLYQFIRKHFKVGVRELTDSWIGLRK